MKNIMLGKSDIKVPAVAVGCMRIGDMEEKDLVNHLNYCVEQGLNFFDHADIYGGGNCEKVFAKAFKETGLDF